MTTDITELARRVEHIISDMKLKHGDKDTYAPVMKWDEFLALVEALEKAQQTEKTLESRNRRLDGINTAAEKRIAELEFRTVTAAAAEVLAERKRQVSAEGWTPGHDDEYEHGELADAAGCYALSSELFDCAGEPPRPWPWPDEWWKPTNRRRDLVKAGALILAEIERLDRAAGIKVEAE